MKLSLSFHKIRKSILFLLFIICSVGFPCLMSDLANFLQINPFNHTLVIFFSCYIVMFFYDFYARYLRQNFDFLTDDQKEDMGTLSIITTMGSIFVCGMFGCLLFGLFCLRPEPGISYSFSQILLIVGFFSLLFLDSFVRKKVFKIFFSSKKTTSSQGDVSCN